MFTVRYGLIPYIKQIAFRLLKVKHFYGLCQEQIGPVICVLVFTVLCTVSFMYIYSYLLCLY